MVANYAPIAWRSAAVAAVTAVIMAVLAAVLGGSKGLIGALIGVAVVALNAFAQFFFIPAYPFWSLTIIAVDMVALYGLCVYGSRSNVTAE